MQVLRENKESLMAVLEAFVYDPLINWKLLGAGAPKGKEDRGKRRSRIEEAEEWRRERSRAEEQ